MRGLELLNDWKFYLGEPEEPHLLSMDDSTWRTVNIPHDWSVEFSFDKEKGETCTGFLLGGIGWYRKHFITTEEMVDKKILLNFDGIYNRATIYCNGELVTFHPYGYSPCVVDVTDFLNATDEDNVIAVRVDHSRYVDSRWYTGSGIYRKVAMYTLPQIHIPVWGISFTTPEISDEVATVEGVITVNSEKDIDENIEVVTNIYDEDNLLVASNKTMCCVGHKSSEEILLKFQIDNPKKWEIHNSKLYTAKVELLQDGESIQEESVNFGIREFRFDVNKGFFFNGKNTLIKGVCLHHDGGLVGAAVPKDVWRRRLERLKSCGCNAIRTGHTPASEDFLDLCDEMGFLVQAEFFDEWDNPKDKRSNGEEKFVDYLSRSYTEFFRDYAQSDLQNSVRRDRNHPCIFQWCIGNEIEWTYTKYNVATGYFGMNASGNYFWTLPPNSKEEIRENISRIPRDYYDIDKTARKLVAWTKELDTTRPVIANCILPSASYENGYIDALDMVGYSYRRVMYDYGHENYPDKPIMGTENVPHWHEWKAVIEREHISGLFLWTGIDHMGEGQAQRPFKRKGSNYGLLDFAGFEKQPYHMFRSLWQDEPHIKLYSQILEDSIYKLDDNGEVVEREQDGWQQRVWYWHEMNEHWNYEKNDETVIEVLSNCEEVSLYLNDELISTKYLSDFDDHIYKWFVPYTEGTIKAIGKKGEEIVETIINTTGTINAIDLEVDKEIIQVNSDSVAHITIQLLDEQGNAIKNQDEKIEFKVEGNAKILGVDNGHPDNLQDYQNDSVVTSQGRCLMILQGLEKGEVVVRAKCPEKDLISRQVTIKIID